MPELVLKLGDNVLQNYVFDKDVMSIGRSRDNDVVVENLSVSRNHARIRLQNGKYILTDLNSANGTYVNGVRVSKTEIVDGDVVSIGKHKLSFAHKPIHDDDAIVQTFGADRTIIVDRTPTAVLCMLEGRMKGQEFALAKFETSIGKANTNDVVLSEDWFLAKKQAVVVKRGNNEYELYDSGGIRKTKINGNAIIKPTVLKPGDLIEFGSVKCVFQWSGSESLPHGRVPMEISAEDSVYATGVRYAEEIALTPNADDAPIAQPNPHDSEWDEPAAEASPSWQPQAPEPPDSEPISFENLTPEVDTPPLPQAVASSDKQLDDTGTDRSVIFSRGESVSEEEEEEDERQESAEVVSVSSLSSENSAPQSGQSQDNRSSKKKRRQQERRNRQGVRQQGGPEMIPENDDFIPSEVVSPQSVPVSQEVELWEAALNNRSPVIRRQAARMLKKLTGRDYEE